MDEHLPDAVVEPVPRALERLLRQAVLAHAHDERRRTFPPVVHAGTPGRRTISFPLGDALDGLRLDHAVRTDVVEAMVQQTGLRDPLVWLTRRGELSTQDVDLAWLSAVRTAAGELGRTLPFVVVNRRSWRDPRSGVGRSWQRLRDSR